MLGPQFATRLGVFQGGHAELGPYMAAFQAGPPEPVDDRQLLCRLMCGKSHMATNLSIDPELINRALEVSGERTKKAAVTKALQEFIARRRQKRMLDLLGKLE